MKWVALVMWLAACGQPADDPSGDTLRPSGEIGAVAVPPVSTGACPADGRWARCSILRRLEQSGLAPRPESASVHRKPLTQPGILVHVGRADLQLFIYPDSAARARDEARLDSGDFVTGQGTQTFRAEPTLVTSVNLLAILDSRSETQRERVWLAITAGPPQP